MKEVAKVIEIKSNKRAVVEVERTTACGECGKCSVGKKNLSVKAEVDNPFDAKIGDIVEVEMQFGDVMGASLICYGIPLLLFLLGCALGNYVLAPLFSLNKDLCSIGMGAFMLVVSYLGIRHFDKKGAFKERFTIKIVG